MNRDWSDRSHFQYHQCKPASQNDERRLAAAGGDGYAREHPMAEHI
jgi:hypothetical protein